MSVVNPKAGEGAKKAPLHLLEPAADEAISRVLALGAEKYGRRNFTVSNIAISTYLAAARRHLTAIVRGEDIDPESGESHWAHLGANAHVVLAALEAGTLVDDRVAEVKEPEVPQEYDVRVVCGSLRPLTEDQIQSFLESIEPDEDPSPQEPTPRAGEDHFDAAARMYFFGTRGWEGSE